MREDHGGEIGAVLLPELGALQAQLGESHRLLDGPVGDGGIQKALDAALLQGLLDAVGEPHWGGGGEELQEDDAEGVDVRFDPQHSRLLVLGIDVAEGAGGGGEAVLRDGVGDGGGDEPREADVGDLADEVVVEEDVAGLKVAVDEGLGLGLVEEEEPGGDLGGDPEAELPGERRRVRAAEEAVLEAAVGHVLVDEASVLGASSHEEDHVRMADAAQHLDLEKITSRQLESERLKKSLPTRVWGGNRSEETGRSGQWRRYLLLELLRALGGVRPEDLDRDGGAVQSGSENRSVSALPDLQFIGEVFRTALDLLDGVSPVRDVRRQPLQDLLLLNHLLQQFPLARATLLLNLGHPVPLRCLGSFWKRPLFVLFFCEFSSLLSSH